MSHAFSDLSGWPLHDATQKGDTAAMAKLVASGTDVNVREPERGWTALHVAAETNQVEALRWLAANGALLDVRDHDDDTPMHCAAFMGHTDCVGWLMALGANVQLTNKYTFTPYDTAVRNGRTETAQVIQDES